MAMKKCVILISGVLLLLTGCQQGGKQPTGNKEPAITDSVMDTASAPTGESLYQIQNQEMLWQVRDSPTLRLQKPVKTGLDTMTVMHVIDLINANEDSIRLELVKTSHDTVFVHIPNAENLTERIGSTGAEMYMASMTYSLTSVKGIHFVDYDFVEGDHAAPGVYDRSYFANLQ